MARIALAHPLILADSATEESASSPYFPLGLLYLAGYVRDHGHEVTVYDGTFQVDESSFVEHLRVHSPDLVGISAVVTNRSTALRFAALAHEAGTVVIMGGPDPTMNPAVYLASGDVDVVVHHEGEQTVTRLLDLVDQRQLVDCFAHEPGIAYRRNGQVTINEPRPPIEDLDTLPLPARDLIDMERYLDQWRVDSGYTSITVAATRGCPYGCDWCADAVHGQSYRQRSPESVAAELQHLEDTYGVDSIRLVDDVDGIDRSWFDAWAAAAAATDSSLTFEPLNQIERTDLPLLDVRDSL